MWQFTICFVVVATKARLFSLSMEASFQQEELVSVKCNDTKENSLRKEKYPPIKPYSTGNLKVSEIHTLYWEQNGNPDGYVSWIPISAYRREKNLDILLSKTYQSAKNYFIVNGIHVKKLSSLYSASVNVKNLWKRDQLFVCEWHGMYVKIDIFCDFQQR